MKGEKLTLIECFPPHVLISLSSLHPRSNITTPSPVYPQFRGEETEAEEDAPRLVPGSRRTPKADRIQKAVRTGRSSLLSHLLTIAHSSALQCHSPLLQSSRRGQSTFLCCTHSESFFTHLLSVPACYRGSFSRSRQGPWLFTFSQALLSAS